MNASVTVLCSGGLGAVLRFVVDQAVGRRATRPFPYGTLVVNVTAAGVMGLVTGLTFGFSDHVLAAIGGYSTFSTWMLESQRLEEDRRTNYALINIVVSMVLGLIAALLGQWAAASLLGHSIGEQL